MGRYRDKKFKVWDKEKKEWFSPIYEGYNNKIFEILISLKGSLIIRNEGFEINGHKGNTIHESCFPNRFELVQYTGLKDKNGKEIYEGDVVEYLDSSEPVGYSYEREEFWNIGKVIWNEEYARFDITNREDVDTEDVWSEIIVIGNIYESLELLEGN